MTLSITFFLNSVFLLIDPHTREPVCLQFTDAQTSKFTIQEIQETESLLNSSTSEEPTRGT